ncbi:hypothetical protein HDE_07754 [Halotydeus destructor]|nr:hypothetical protein HDE_07754 [Halotydeus destructor]
MSQATHETFFTLNAAAYHYPPGAIYDGQIMDLLTVAMILPLALMLVLCIMMFLQNFLTCDQYYESRRNENGRHYDDDVMQVSYEYPPKYEHPPSYQTATSRVVKKYTSSSL